MTVAKQSLGFNYAYRRTPTNNVAPTPNSTTSSLPNATSNPPTKGSTPIQAEKSLSPHSRELRSPVAPAASGKVTPKEPPPSTSTLPKSNESGTSTPSSDRAEKERQKRKDKKDRKDRERAEVKTEAKEKEASISEDKPDLTAPVPAPDSVSSSTVEPNSGKATPEVPIIDAREGMKSPTTDSTGTRTPTSKRPQRHPWTLFVKLPQQSTEADVKEFFGGEAAGVTKVTFLPNRGSPHHRARPFVYVEFGDDATMRAGLQKNDEVSPPLILNC